MQKITKELLIKYLNKGLTPVQISKELEVARASIYRAIKKYDLSFKTEKDKTKERDKKICELFSNSDLALQDIADKFNCTKSNICLILQKYNLSVPTERKNRNRRKTIQKKYGADNVMHVKEIIEKREKYFINKYGAKSPFENKEIQKKTKTTLFDKYGVYNPQRKHLPKKTLEFIRDPDSYKFQLIKWHIDEQLTVEEIATKLGYIDPTAIYNKFHEFKIPVQRFFRSNFEKQVEQYIKLIWKGDLYINSRKYNSELDLYIPDKNIAIECNGLYYHSFNEVPTSKQKNYHKRKTELCRENNIRLFHILECEWYDEIKQQIWKSILSNNLQKGINTRVFARKCKCQIIKNIKLVKDFYNNNHLQGFVGSSVHIGLFFDNILVSCMSFTESRQNKNEWILTRFASLVNYNIIGGASKIFKFFLNKYDSEEIVTFADLRYSYGSIYEILGFNIIGKVQPRYCYTDNKVLIHRRNFQKKRLKKMLGKKYDPSISEFRNVFENTRYRVIYDAGKIKYKWKRKHD